MSGYAARNARGARPAKCLTCGLRFDGPGGVDRARVHGAESGHILLGIPEPTDPPVAGAEGAQERFAPRPSTQFT